MLHLGVPGQDEVKVHYYGSIGSKMSTLGQSDMITEVLGVKDNNNLRDKLGLYLIPNEAIDLLLGTHVRAPLLAPLVYLCLRHPFHKPGLHLQKHAFR